MENYAFETVEAISDYYRKDGKDGKELTKDILFYLYHTTTDDQLKQKIVEWFNEENYCIECGTELLSYEWSETHTELDDNSIEWFTYWLCPICDRNEVENSGYTIKD